MSKLKKFGTFGGVFTPSLLTILGVIMYMRLGTVVGNSSGIFMLISIILFAHIISITTGFSVSSIATDKKIKAGGIYYILTRSLGFPIGGAIGLTLYVATALSISLYLIGFAESMLPVIQDLMGIETISINHLRIGGTMALMLVLFIAYKSTSFAIKIQYVILTLIGLSLISIFTGSSEGIEKGVDEISNPGFAVLFGIFFPAVTGFTAGVAMSGDLKNPSKSIPWGTMMAILVGLVVYIILALFINASIDKEILVSNNNALIQFGSVTFLVIAGVWGATLSSALGGILGGPRILQAMSLDKITPRIFGKGHGVNNEPRNALILTFIISEIGILIGELNVIAEVVAMFYMAAYLFINVSCFLEQWASPDFRPKLKIPLWVSLLGAVTTFLLMIQLNLPATLASVLLMIIIFIWLTRKELVLGTGDVWTSVWTLVVKIGLKNLYKKSTHRRNWQPNILLFSGGTKERPHLIEMSKSITARGGMISNFDLIEEESAEMLFPKHHQSFQNDDLDDDSIFHRKLNCQNVFKGIEAIANTYGFSGIDPNTVLMGWARNTKDPIWFAQMTHKLHLLDYNILYLDYDKKKGFGDFKRIDIWWEGFDKDCYLTLHLSKIISHSSDWNRAQIRVLYVNETNSHKLLIEDFIKEKIEKYRVDISLEIINNEIEKKDIFKLINLYSNDSDLILMSLPEINKGKELKYVNSINGMLDVMGSTLLIKAASYFEEDMSYDPELEQIYKQNKALNEELNIEEISVVKTKVASIDKMIMLFDQQINENNKVFCQDVYDSFSECYDNFSKTINTKSDQLKIGNKTITLSKYVEDFRDNRVRLINESVNKGIDQHIKKLNELIESIPVMVNMPIHGRALKILSTDSISLIRLKRKYKKKLERGKQLRPYKVKLRDLCLYHFENGYLIEYEQILRSFGITAYVLNQSFKNVLNLNQTEDKNHVDITNEIGAEFDKKIIHHRDQFMKKLNQLSKKWLNTVLIDLLKLNIEELLINREEEINSSQVKGYYNIINNYHFTFKNNYQLLLNQLVVYLQIRGFHDHVHPLIDNCKDQFQEYIFHVKSSLFKEILNDLNKQGKIDLTKEYFIEKNNAQFNIDDQLKMVNDKAHELVVYFKSEIQVFSQQAINQFEEKQNDLPKEIILLPKIINNLFEEILISLNEIFIEFNNASIEEMEIVKNTVELYNFTINNQTDKSLVKEVCEKSLNQLNKSIQKIEDLESRFIISYNNLVSSMADYFNDEIIIERSKSKAYTRSKSSQNKGINKVFNKVSVFLDNYYEKLNKSFIQIQDSFTIKSHLHKNRALKTPINKVNNYIEKVLPDTDVVNRLPMYYKQLFLDEQISPNEPLVNRKDTFNKITKSINNFKEGNEGAVVVTGERGAGKSYLIKNVINCMEDVSFFSVLPPSSISSNVNKNIQNGLERALNKKGTTAELLKLIPDQSIIHITDYEMWWSRSEIGYKQLEKWEKIFKEQSKKILFIIECNIHFYSYIKNVSNLENLVLKTIVLKPFSTQQIKEVILESSNIGGLNFIFKDTRADKLKSVKMNRLFSRINYLSEGNIGLANLIWIAGIQEIEDDDIYLKEFKYIKMPDVLIPIWELIILQIVIQNKMKVKELCQLFKDENYEYVNEQISHLVRMKILISEKGVLSVNSYLYPYLIKHLRFKNLLD